MNRNVSIFGDSDIDSAGAAVEAGCLRDLAQADLGMAAGSFCAEISDVLCINNDAA